MAVSRLRGENCVHAKFGLPHSPAPEGLTCEEPCVLCMLVHEPSLLYIRISAHKAGAMRNFAERGTSEVGRTLRAITHAVRHAEEPVCVPVEIAIEDAESVRTLLPLVIRMRCPRRSAWTLLPNAQGLHRMGRRMLRLRVRHVVRSRS